MLAPATSGFFLFTLIIMRMSGAILLNPIYSRNSIPNLYKAGIILILSILIFPTVPAIDIQVTNSFMYGFLLMKELIIGLCLALVMHIFEMVPVYAGYAIDFKMGISMATVYDVQSGSQMALTGNILQIFYLLLFFAVDGHAALFKIFITSHEVVPYTQLTLGIQAYEAMVKIFCECIALAVKLALPIIAFELLVEVAIGLLMRIISQINLFILSIQLRILVGISLLVFLISPIGDYLEEVVTLMMQAVQDMLMLLG